MASATSFNAQSAYVTRTGSHCGQRGLGTGDTFRPGTPSVYIKKGLKLPAIAAQRALIDLNQHMQTASSDKALYQVEAADHRAWLQQCECCVEFQLFQLQALPMVSDRRLHLLRRYRMLHFQPARWLSGRCCRVRANVASRTRWAGEMEVSCQRSQCARKAAGRTAGCPQ